MIYMASAIQRWKLQGLDLAFAFLQTELTAADNQLYTYGRRNFAKLWEPQKTTSMAQLPGALALVE